MEIYILILLVIIPGSYFSDKSYEDLRKLLSRNDTMEWLKAAELHNGTSPYCQLCCVNITARTLGKHCGSHTLCKFQGNKTGPICRGYIDVFFTDPEKQAIVDAHNTLRNNIALGLESRGNPGPQPSAANMREILWDDELASIAERWAAQCVFAHDRCRDTERFPVGQNLARGNLATTNELSLIYDWYGEVSSFDNGEVASYKMPDEGIHEAGRFSQMIWADTYQIGCARAIFQQNQNSQFVYKEHLICNYGPTGNIPYQQVYQIGSPCASCPEGTACSLDYTGLCEYNAKGDVQKLKNASNLHKCTTVLLVIVYLFYCIYLYNTF